jgi:hypothetical protein
VSSPAPGNGITAATDALKTTTDALNATKAELSRLKRSRKTDRILGALLVLALLGLGFNSVRVSRADAVAQAGHASSLAACRASNVTRAKEVHLWNHLASLSKPAPGETKRQIAENKREVDEFLAYVAKTFAPRDCDSLYRLSP